MSQMIEELQAEGRTLEVAMLFPRQGEWTEDDYLSLPETNRIVELSSGRLIITPSPTIQHQRILGKLYRLIGDFVLLNKLGEVVLAPMDVRLCEGRIREPDIVFMSNEHRDRIHEQYLDAPDLVMEIISEGTEYQDRVDKLGEYQKAGIPEYWIVDPSKQTIEVFTLENRTYVQFGKWGAGETAHSKLLAGFQVVVDKVTILMKL